MARILVVAHAGERFVERGYLLESLFPHWRARGHEVTVREGPERLPPADVAILHVDATVVPPPYLAALSGHRVVLNRALADIGKRTISRQLVQRGDGWDGPVIVKGNLNCGGVPEALRAASAARRGLRVRGPKLRGYEVLASAREVPSATWDDTELVVERFLPERDPRGYAARFWVFLGDRERCNRYVEEGPIVRGTRVVAREPCPVPEELRVHRARLDADYGKIDFVVHDGVPVLLDVNRTPTLPRALAAKVVPEQAALAEGIDAFLR